MAAADHYRILQSVKAKHDRVNRLSVEWTKWLLTGSGEERAALKWPISGTVIVNGLTRNNIFEHLAMLCCILVKNRTLFVIYNFYVWVIPHSFLKSSKCLPSTCWCHEVMLFSVFNIQTAATDLFRSFQFSNCRVVLVLISDFISEIAWTKIYPISCCMFVKKTPVQMQAKAYI